MAKRFKNEVTLDDMAQLMDVDTPVDWQERNIHNFLCSDLDEDHLDAEVGEAYIKYCDALQGTFEWLLSNFDLILDEKKCTKYLRGNIPYVYSRYYVKPAHSWRRSCEELIGTINGAGPFYFNSVKEFLDSGPYTPKQGVITHLHWMKRYPDVYGERSPRSRIERVFR